MVRIRKTDYSRMKSRGFGQFRNPSLYNSRKKPERKKFHFSFAIFKLVLFVAVLIVGAYYLFLSPIFIVKEILVEGVSLVSKEDVVKMIPKNQNLLLMDTQKIINNIIASHSEVSDVQIFRGLPDAVKIIILEKDGSIVWQSGEIKYLVSTQGEVARQIKGDEGVNLPVVIDKKNVPVVASQKIVSANFIVFVKNVFDSFFTETNIKPVNFEINETTFDVNLVTDAGFYIKMNSLRSSKKQIDNLKLVLASKRSEVREYIDLRIDGWAYYK